MRVSMAYSPSRSPAGSARRSRPRRGRQKSQQSAEEWLKAGGSDNIKDAQGVLPGFKKKYWSLLKNISKEISIEFVAAGAFELMKKLVITAM
jgi:hypothetical protein